MKMIKKIAAVGCALTMAVSMMSISVSAEKWGLYHSQGAPSTDTRIYQEIFLTPEYNGRLGGNCSSYSLSSGNVRATAYRLMAGTDGHIYGIYINHTDIISNGGCDIRKNIITPSIYCEVDINFTDSNAYGSAYGVYK